jgi:hypothetical protein
MPAVLCKGDTIEEMASTITLIIEGVDVVGTRAEYGSNADDKSLLEKG